MFTSFTFLIERGRAMELLDAPSPRGKVTVLVIALLAALTLCASAVAAGPGESSVVVRVPAQARAQVAAAGVRPAQRLDYGSFDWLEVEAADLARLDSRGVPYVVVPDARQVRVPGYPLRSAGGRRAQVSRRACAPTPPVRASG